MNTTNTKDHKQGCEAIGGYGHGVGPCTCGAVDLQPAAAQPQDMREAFEAWASEDFYSGLTTISDNWSQEKGTYADYAHHMAWHAWQAARTQGYTAGDMASAAADGFRDGVASAQASEPSEEEQAIRRAAKGWQTIECPVCGGLAQGFPKAAPAQASEPSAAVFETFPEQWKEPVHAPARAVEPLTEAMVVAAARVLNARLAEACNINADDQWKIHGDDFKEDARAALQAAHGIPATTPTKTQGGEA